MLKQDYTLQLAILEEEKRIATQILNELKKSKDFGRKFNAIRVYRNRVCAHIRELRAGVIT